MAFVNCWQLYWKDPIDYMIACELYLSRKPEFVLPSFKYIYNLDGSVSKMEAVMFLRNVGTPARELHIT